MRRFTFIQIAFDRNIEWGASVQDTMRLLLTLTFSTLVLQFASPMRAQQPATAQTKSDLSVEAKLVVVPATVRDKKGALVATLKKEDFVLQIDGKPHTIRYFDHDSDVPLTLGLLVDTSQSQRSALDAERSASSAFLDKMLTPHRDNAFVVQFARQVELLQDVTDSRPKLQEALKQLDTSSPSFQPSAGGDDGDRDRYTRGGTALYDAVFLSADEVMSKQKGRRALILLTDGADRNSKESLVNAIESAQRADTIVYAIYYKGEEQRGDNNGGFPGGGHRNGGGGWPGGGGGGGWPGGGGGYPGGQSGGGNPGGGRRGGGGAANNIDGKKVLERICGETGGRVFEVNKKQTVDVIYGQIAEELRAQYRLGFTPSADAASDGYHQIAVTLTAAEAKNRDAVQTRDGYYTRAGK